MEKAESKKGNGVVRRERRRQGGRRKWGAGIGWDHNLIPSIETLFRMAGVSPSPTSPFPRTANCTSWLSKASRAACSTLPPSSGMSVPITIAFLHPGFEKASSSAILILSPRSEAEA